MALSPDEQSLPADEPVEPGFRVSLDDRNETLNYRIRDGELAKTPYLAVVGQREAEQGTLAIRTRGEGTKQEVIPVPEFVARLTKSVAERSLAL